LTTIFFFFFRTKRQLKITKQTEKINKQTNRQVFFHTPKLELHIILNV
jgi:hypothetical protein